MGDPYPRRQAANRGAWRVGAAGSGCPLATLAVTIIAQNSQSARSSGVGAGLIVGTIIGVLVAIAVIWFVFTRMTQRSRGGVEPVEGERRRGNPPVEGIERGGGTRRGDALRAALLR